METLAHYLSIIIMSAFKFELGPFMALKEGLSVYESIILCFTGMMAMVILLAYGGSYIKEKFKSRPKKKKRKIFTKKNRLIVKIWRKDGIKGVAFLTPILFGPPLGMIIILTLGADKRQIIKYMFISAVMWSAVINISLFYFSTYIHAL
ncbi:hypothetical protein [Flammeovirga sp. SubArs3]|uniref:hypothetical protein n=1 Tax=Flammeovirga sp. SubArs3 TaxID=2995316 RepID=UPI00248AADEC|nr:hypothetical protein [Flammeovirga sp. SubArs3]